MYDILFSAFFWIFLFFNQNYQSQKDEVANQFFDYRLNKFLLHILTFSSPLSIFLILGMYLIHFLICKRERCADNKNRVNRNSLAVMLHCVLVRSKGTLVRDNCFV